MDSEYVVSKKSLKALEVNVLDGRSFIPDVELDNLMTSRAILATIKERCENSGREYELERLAHEIFTHSKKIFAILILMGEENLVRDFVHERYRDSSLLHSSEPPTTMKNPEGFQEKKWRFLAPILEAGDFHREFSARTIIPIVSESMVGGDSGSAGGTVFKVELYQAQQKLAPHTPGNRVFLARKELAKDISEYDAETERKVLEMIRLVKHPNIIELLATYRISGRLNMLFPFAETDLRTFLRTNHDPLPSNKYLFESMRNIASALEAIHNPFISHVGYHHDISPKNILLLGNEFKICDFSLSCIKQQAEETQLQYRAGNLLYGAPEQIPRFGFEYPMVGRKFDIWSLGCVFLEIATHAARGPEGIKFFQQKRYSGYDDDFYFIIVKSEGGTTTEVKKEIIAWIAELKEEDDEGELSLVLDLVKEMLKNNPEERPTAKRVRQELDKITSRGNEAREERITPNHRDGAALLAAASEGNELMVTRLLEGMDPKHQDADGRTALVAAASSGHELVVSQLLERGADLNHQDSDGRTALYWAVFQGYTPVVRLLLEKGADPNLQTLQGWTALRWAVKICNKAMIELLLQKATHPRHSAGALGTALLAAARRGHWSVISLLHENGADLNYQDEDGLMALSEASTRGYDLVVAQLLREATNPKYPTEALGVGLLTAVNNNHESTVGLLLEAGADPNYQCKKTGVTALRMAVKAQYELVVRRLLGGGADPNDADSSGSALRLLAIRGDKLMVQQFLDAGADPNYRDPNGSTARLVASCMDGA